MKPEPFDAEKYKQILQQIIVTVNATHDWEPTTLRTILNRFPRDGKAIFSRDQLVSGYRLLVKENILLPNQETLDRIKMKPTRTMSGVVPVTVLTKPFPCPGKCIFCPNDVRMPKSYLADEPGAQRAERNSFDPYLQTYNRLQALADIGHPTDKVELIILGGTWSFYPEAYQIWFIKRCFEALNDFGVRDRREQVTVHNLFEEADKIPARRPDGKKKTYNEIVHAVARNKSDDLISATEQAGWEELFAQHTLNENARSRCIGLVIETRPDYIDKAEVIKIRKLGATKVQIGIQSLNDTVMNLNKRGHGAAETAKAIRLLRLGAFKIHAHWMPNLYGSSVAGDIADYQKLWDEKYAPDELKIYPTSVIANTELNELYQQGKFQPYSHADLLHVLREAMRFTPRFCRLTRVIRDIPSTDIVAGNKLTNFRQIAENSLHQDGLQCQCIRCREIRGTKVSESELVMEELEYKSSIGSEVFLQFKTLLDDKIVGFLRLALPRKTESHRNFITELRDCALIREVHVYGQVVGIGERADGKSQHLGLGTRLISRAKEIAITRKFKSIAVISAIGTRKYYQKFGFDMDGLYMKCSLSS